MKHLLIILALVLMPGILLAQHVAVKTNLLSDVALSPDLALEVKMSRKWTMDINGQLNFWTVDNRKWKHWLVQPEARLWFCDAFTGHFMGLHAIGGQYNFGNLKLYDLPGSELSRLKDHRYQGWAAGAGIAYGYDWVLDKHWNFEAEIGIGWIYTRYDEFECMGCGRRTRKDVPHNYFGPTKAALNIVYLF